LKDRRVAKVVETWCGQSPVRGSDRLQALWETHGLSGVPFDDEGAERLIQGLEREFPGHGLRPVDVLGLMVDGLIDAIRDSVVEPVVAFTLATRRVPAPAETAVPAVVSLSDETIERLSTRIAELLNLARRAEGAASSARRSSRAQTVRKSPKGSLKSGRSKVR